MKTNPAAVDVSARWAEVSEKRKALPLLTELLGIKEDKTALGPPGKVLAQKVAHDKAQGVESHASPTVAKRLAAKQDVEKKKTPDDFHQAKLKEMKAATWTPRPGTVSSSKPAVAAAKAVAKDEQGMPPTAGAGTAGKPPKAEEEASSTKRPDEANQAAGPVSKAARLCS